MRKKAFKSFIKRDIIFRKFLLIIILFFLNTKNNNNKYRIIFNKTENNNKNNKGFLLINTTHKGKFSHYHYWSNIKVYKDLYNNIEYVPITSTNTIVNSSQLSKEKYSEICEKGILLDKTKYKRNTKPKISVVIPYYNKGLISPIQVLRSIQNQSFKDLEIIFVDDGSKVRSIKEILEAMKDDNRIILLRHKRRKTILLTRVDGIRFCSGEYIIQIDQDDMYLNNQLFERLYNKAKKLDVDIIQFDRFTSSSSNKKKFKLEYIDIPKNVIIYQPELKTAFYHKVGENRLDNLLTRAIWNKFVRREIFLEAIEDLGDEYMNHKFHYYEDTLMSFELSQIANSYFYYDIEGYRHCTYNSEKTTDRDNAETTALNCLLFIKLLLYKMDPKYDRYFIFKELQFCGCGQLIRLLNKNYYDLGLEVLEVILELQRIYNNTAQELLSSVNLYLSHFKN